MKKNLVDSYMNESNKLDGSNYLNGKNKVYKLLEATMTYNIASGKQDKPEAPANLVQDWVVKTWSWVTLLWESSAWET